MSLTAEQRFLLERTARRADQVAKVARLALRTGTFLPVVMTLPSWLLMRTLMLLCGEALQRGFFTWLRETLQEEAGLCTLCGQPKDKVTDVCCAVCLKQFEEEDRELDAYEAMERAPEGPPQ